MTFGTISTNRPHQVQTPTTDGVHQISDEQTKQTYAAIKGDSLGRAVFSAFSRLTRTAISSILNGFDKTKAFVTREKSFNTKRASTNRIAQRHVHAQRLDTTSAQKPAVKEVCADKHSIVREGVRHAKEFVTSQLDIGTNNQTRRHSHNRIAQQLARNDLSVRN